MKTVLCIGSNIGNRLDNLKQARNRVCSLPNTRLISQSKVYETEPVDVKPEHEDLTFLNAILLIDNKQEPQSLLKELKAIEGEMGRVQSTELNTPRSIDIDIIFMENSQINTPTLTIPHPRWHERLFVVCPLAEVLPDFTPPNDNRTIMDVLLSLPKTPKVLPLCEKW